MRAPLAAFRVAITAGRGYRDLATLVIAIERGNDRRRAHTDTARIPTKEAAIVVTA